MGMFSVFVGFALVLDFLCIKRIIVLFRVSRFGYELLCDVGEFNVVVFIYLRYRVREDFYFFVLVFKFGIGEWKYYIYWLLDFCWVFFKCSYMEIVGIFWWYRVLVFGIGFSFLGKDFCLVWRFFGKW